MAMGIEKGRVSEEEEEEEEEEEDGPVPAWPFVFVPFEVSNASVGKVGGWAESSMLLMVVGGRAEVAFTASSRGELKST